MPTALQMPKLGLTMQEGTVVEWRCRPGDGVRQGQVVLLIESEKVEFEIEAPADGTLRTVLVEEGTTVPCGELLAVLTPTPDEPFDLDELRSSISSAVADTLPRQPSSQGTTRRPRHGRERPHASPRARRLAAQEGVELSQVEGTGAEGRRTESDVRRAIEQLGPRITLGDARLAYTDVDGPEPAVLFVAGFAFDRTAFNLQLSTLSGWRRLVAPDLRGTGSSTDPGEEALSIERLATDLGALIERLKLKHVDLVGSSLGAATGAELARRQPELVRRLVLLSPPALPDARLWAILDAVCRASESEIAELRHRVLLPWILGRRLLSDPSVIDRAVQSLSGLVARVPTRTLRRQRDALVTWLERAEETYASIRTPTLVIIGEDDLLTPPLHAETVARMVPGSRLERLEEIGHGPMVEAPDQLEALLRDFLDAG
ncbi:MAG: alpha/beta fold hydrolase [Myxococcota bacterium]